MTKKMGKTLINIVDISGIKSRSDTSHECECCDKSFCGVGAALVLLKNGKDRIICRDCVDKYKDNPPPIISREQAEAAVPLKDCSGRTYSANEREDIIRYVLEGAEIQRDVDYYGSGKNKLGIRE